MRNGQFTITNIKAPRRIQRLCRKHSDRRFALLCAIYIIGIAFGALFLAFNDGLLLEYILFSVKSGIAKSAGGGFLSEFLSFAFSGSVVLFVLFIFSSCIYGAPLILASILCSGAGFGIVCGAVYVNLGFSGILFILTVFVAPAVISAYGSFFFASAALVSSHELYKLTYRSSGKSFIAINELLLKELLKSAVFLVVSSLVRSVGIVIFGGSGV